ncbi:FAD/NAD(P)-binding protein [Streptomyces silvisoli]|uniref:FAD/NAD(P)-binding protein n=1 Tax=Streptomyces silvisoli TaxID=3034235 RepID=A0ABT5ZKR5_9ACTN|nr:FAD/NAD(P)-binding protein [Streptomyces silvisoli]MDF3290427.1 FAD/NAD(P)-binding protein [Streptomyces silvisoli]
MPVPSDSPPYPARPVQPDASVPSLVIVGAGPRGTGLLERIAANAPDVYGGSRLDIHMVDPYPAGAGRVWRYEQSPLLWMNSMAEDVTMFLDESVECAGPIRPGPSLAQWAERVRAGSISPPPELAGEIGELRADGFPSRRVQSAYLGWVYEQAVAALPPGVRVHRHPYRAVRVTGPLDGRQRVWLDGVAAPLTADLVVLALGHLDSEPDPEQRALSAFAARHGLVHLPPGYTADTDLSALRPGQTVIVRGFGLAFIDLMVLLTEGRGGRYESDARGRLTYRPSGREPLLHVGSRRGVPYHSKIGYGWTGERTPLPRFFGPAAVDQLLAGPGPLDFRRDVWPLIAKELGYAFYHRLFTAHPERTRVNWPDFEEKYAAAAPASAELDALVNDGVPDPADRFDPDALDHPLSGLRFPDEESFQRYLCDYIQADLDRRADPRHSPDLAVFLALLAVYGQLVRIIGSGRLTARSRIADLDGWWHGFFSYYASGPPAPRLRQLLALSRAGVVRFLGAGLTVEADRERGVFRASSPGVPGKVEATALVEARLPGPSVHRSRDRLLRSLAEDGAGGEEMLRDGDHLLPTGLLAVDPADARLIGRDGRPHPRRLALGPHTNGRAYAAFARPRTNAPAFRQNDATARAVLAFLGERPGTARLSA